VTRTLSVWWDGSIVGTLQVNEHGEMRFTYSAGWIADASRPAISFSLPKRPEPFKQRQCRPFFAGLLPEASQRDAIAGALGISKRNDFAFLEALGGDVAGALTLWPEGEAPPFVDPAGEGRALTDDELVEILDALPTRPLLAGREGLRLSLAGAQSKLPVVLVDGRVALPAPGQPTTHILKPPIARFPHTGDGRLSGLVAEACHQDREAGDARRDRSDDVAGVCGRGRPGDAVRSTEGGGIGRGGDCARASRRRECGIDRVGA
jgi:serine/threonine-protein kinase HipA